MAVPIEFWRGALGLLCLFFAHMAGRSAAGVRAGRLKLSRLYGWLLRTTLCAAALLFRRDADALVIAVYTLALGAFALGWWVAQRPRQEEDLTGEIFPDNDKQSRQ